MTIIGEILLPNLLAYLINIASGERSAAIAATRERNLKEVLKKDEDLKKAVASAYSIRDEIRTACTELARKRVELGVTPLEEPLWRLLSDEVFQEDLAEWLSAGAIEEGNAVKHRLLQRMEMALAENGGRPEQISFLRTGYFEAIEKAVFADPILAHWRHQLSLDYLRGQVDVLRRRAEEAAGVFSAPKQNAALDRYCEKALSAWDIIDLSNLPEGDVHIVTQKLLLRQLYMALRIEFEPSTRGQDEDAALARFEAQREARRHREAGHVFGDESKETGGGVSRVPIGERLKASRRLVVLGDPGGGKTTILRWMATAYLLRHKGDDAFSQVPDTQTLPNQPWIPVLIRCRDLGDADLCRCFTDFLTQHLSKTELLPEEAVVMRAVILDRISKGEVVLLVDGLDEITSPRVRMMFCQELERTAARYPGAPIVITSRIVGYRDMPYRMGSGFEHGQIAELDREDKDLFARRWVKVTEQNQPPIEQAKRASELLEALHSSDRIERLTGNPMLLTTLALVKRKVGKLPNRRTKLYAEAVSVLLNWNPRLYQTIDEDEAIPQLEYLAYEMCRRGVQRLTGDEVLDLLDRLRTEYPNVRAISRREPIAFLALLEARSSILIKSGGIWQKSKGNEKQIWEFRHLTFQEYLAARALLDGRYPGREKGKSLAEQVAPLGGPIETPIQNSPHAYSVRKDDVEIPESWREALRLLVADCKDDDVDEVLLAVLNPLVEEDPIKARRPRAVLATLCLADEPNISEQTANQVLVAFAAAVTSQDGIEHIRTSVNSAALEAGGGIWSQALKRSLIEEFCRRPPGNRSSPGVLWGMVEYKSWSRSGDETNTAVAACVERLKSGDRIETIAAAMTLMYAAYQGKVTINIPGLPEELFALLDQGKPEICAAAFALIWLGGGWVDSPVKITWLPSQNQLEKLAALLNNAPPDESDLKRFLINILGKVGNLIGLRAILPQLDDPASDIRRTAALALEYLADKQAVVPLLAHAGDNDGSVRKVIVRALGKLGNREILPMLLPKLDDPEAIVRQAMVEVLELLKGEQAVPHVIAKLNDPARLVQLAAIEALGQLGDRRAILPLVEMFDSNDTGHSTAIAAALHALGDPRGIAALTPFIVSDNPELRQAAVRDYARHKDESDKRLLSRDSDGAPPWRDPQALVTEAQVFEASSILNIPIEQIRSRYEAMADDLKLRLEWKS